jgi:hypothetical protein
MVNRPLNDKNMTKINPSFEFFSSLTPNEKKLYETYHYQALNNGYTPTEAQLEAFNMILAMRKIKNN